MRTPQNPLPFLALFGALLLAACEASPLKAPDRAGVDHSMHAASVDGPADATATSAPDLARMRAGTARYRNYQHAVADGFIALSPCVEEAPGGMGYHYGHLDRLGTISVDASRPEILLYAPGAGGRMELVGVEFMVNGEAWYAAGNVAPPTVAGVEYMAPNPNHPDPAVAAAYTLHVWLWKHNPAGLFAPFNPDVSCG